MPKAITGERIALSHDGVGYIRRNYEHVDPVKVGDEFVVYEHVPFHIVINHSGRRVLLKDHEYTMVSAPVAEPKELVGGLAQLTEAGMSKMRLLGRAAGIEARVTERLAGTNWYRIEAPEWGEGGFLFTPDEFSVVDEEEEVDDLPEVEVNEAFEVRAIEVRLHDVIWDDNAKAFRVTAIDSAAQNKVVFYGRTNTNTFTQDVRKLDEYVTVQERRK